MAISGWKAWEGEKRIVADVLCGDNLNWRLSVFSTTGQHSIMHEIVAVSDETAPASETTLRITDIKMFYQAIDPTIGGMIELAQTWVWWDLPDAVILLNLETQLQRMERLREVELADQLLAHYRTIFGRSAEITRERILGYELRSLQRLQQEFTVRRTDELPHEVILHREIVDNSGVDHRIAELHQEIDRFNSLEKVDTLDEEMTKHFARRLAVDPAQLTHEHALHWQRSHVEESKVHLQSSLATGQVLGPPENFKEAQLNEMNARIQKLVDSLPAEATEMADKTKAAPAEASEAAAD